MFFYVFVMGAASCSWFNLQISQQNFNFQKMHIIALCMIWVFMCLEGMQLLAPGSICKFHSKTSIFKNSHNCLMHDMCFSVFGRDAPSCSWFNVQISQQNLDFQKMHIIALCIAGVFLCLEGVRFLLLVQSATFTSTL